MAFPDNQTSRMTWVLMAAGCIAVSIGLALGIAIAVPPSGTPSIQLRSALGDNANVLVFQGVGWTSLHPVPPSLAASLVDQHALSRPSEQGKSAFSWSQVLTDIDADDTLQEVGFGFPFRCLTARVVLKVDQGQFKKVVVYGNPIGVEQTVLWGGDGWSRSFFPVQQIIPWRLWFPGVLGNAAIYALCAVFVSLLWSIARAKWRVRHGRCGRCGYPCDSSFRECPECGSAVAQPDAPRTLPNKNTRRAAEPDGRS